MNLMFAKPTYGPSPDPAIDKSHRAAIMQAANRGVTWVGDVSPDRLGWCVARNAVVRATLEAAKEDKVDGIFWVDDDLQIPVDTVLRLLSHKKDFVSGLYFQRAEPFWPVFGFRNKKDSFEWPSQYPQDTLIQCDGVGFGCVYTSVRMLEAVSKSCKSDDEVFGGDFGKKTYGEDFAFCLRAVRVGFAPHVDTGVKCRHVIGPEFSDEQLFRQYITKLGKSCYEAIKLGSTA